MTDPTQPARWIREVYSPGTKVTFGGDEDRTHVSVVILALDEERCIGRCLDSVVDGGFDDVLVLDTGSTDRTPEIVAGYHDRGVRLVRLPWPDSFAEARNRALDAVAPGWVVLLDADEWLTEQATMDLTACLATLSGIRQVAEIAFAPRISDVTRGVSDDRIPRIIRSDSRIRYRGHVHEYPVVTGEPDTPVGLVGIDIEFRHDGYQPAVVEAKAKRERNLALLASARSSDPENPRWLCYTVRDGLPVLEPAEILRLCSALRDLVDRAPTTGDLVSARGYYCLAAGLACQVFAAQNDWTTVLKYCDEVDELTPGGNADAHYFRTVRELVNGVVVKDDLLRTIRLRGDGRAVGSSALDPSGRHLDALLVALIERVRGAGEAVEYLKLCTPWTDTFFDNSVLRATAGAGWAAR
jgi:Glycosyl transferase family 2